MDIIIDGRYLGILKLLTEVEVEGLYLLTEEMYDSEQIPHI